MSNPYYNHPSGQPVASSRGSSLSVRAEFDAISAAFGAVDTVLSGISASSDFRLIYSGAFASDPVQRYNGTALQDGDLYFNTTSKVMKSYAGGTWTALPTSATVLLKTGDTMTGALGGTTATFSGQVQASGFKGNGANLTGFTPAQMVNGIGYTPANKAGDSFTGAINGTNATFSGTMSAGTVQQTSDERKKRKWKKVSPDFLEKLAAVKKAGIFEWKPNQVLRDNVADVGIGAQSVLPFCPEAVDIDEDGDHYLNVSGLAIIACVELAREVMKLRVEIERLKK